MFNREVMFPGWVSRNRWAVLVAVFALLAPSIVAVNALSETFTATNIVGTSTVTSPSHVVSGGTNPSIDVCNASPPTAVRPAGSLCIDSTAVKMYQTTGGGSWSQLGGFTPYGPAGIYGTGDDGTVTFDGVTAVLGVSPISNVYLLTRDVYFDNVTINAGVTVHTGNYRFYVRNVLTLNGTLADDGESGQTPTNTIFGGNAGVGCCPGAYGSSICPAGGGVGALPGGTAGGAGGNQNSGAGNASGTGSFAPRGYAGHNGGNGGQGGGAGGTGGSTSEYSWVQNGDVRAFPWAMAGKAPFAPNNTVSLGSGGGGGGGGAGAGNFGGGGGGASGCWLAVAARHWTGPGTLRARGGNGGNAEVAGAGDGGGGTGGLIAFVTSDTAMPTTDVTGGTAGTIGTGVPHAVNGGTGLVLTLTGN